MNTVIVIILRSQPERPILNKILNRFILQWSSFIQVYINAILLLIIVPNPKHRPYTIIETIIRELAGVVSEI